MVKKLLIVSGCQDQKHVIVAYENNEKQQESVYSKRLRAGKRRTYFFDVRATRANDYYLTITESRKRFNDDGYDKHKLFLYKEDFNKFVASLTEAIDYVKTDLMPDFDFDAFSHEYDEGNPYPATGERVQATRSEEPIAETVASASTISGSSDLAEEPEDKW